MRTTTPGSSKQGPVPTTRTVHGAYRRADGSPVEGSVTFTPSRWQSGHGFVIGSPVVATLVNGEFTIDLEQTSGPGIAVGHYTVKENVPGGRSYQITVPPGGGVLELDAVAPRGGEGCSCGSPECGGGCGTTASSPSCGCDSCNGGVFDLCTVAAGGGGSGSLSFTMNDVMLAAAGKFLSLLGGSMQGPLILQGGPTSPNSATNKAYVDGRLTSLLTLKPTVADKAALPMTSNTVGDVRAVTDTGALYLWSGTAWDVIGRASVPLPTGTASTDGWLMTWDSGSAAWTITQPPQPLPDGFGDGQILTWDDGTGAWYPADHALGTEANVWGNSQLSDGGSFIYDYGTESYQVRKLLMSDLDDGPGNLVIHDGDLLVFDAVSQKWLPKQPTHPLMALARLTDVTLPGPFTSPGGAPGNSGEVLTWDGGSWVPRPLPTPPSPVPNGVNDMDLLTWDASTQAWVTSADTLGDETNVTIPASDAAADHGTLIYDPFNNQWDVQRLSVGDLAETFGVVANDGDVLTYDGGSGQWVLDQPQPGPQGPPGVAAFPVVVLTRAAYTALAPKDPNTVYVIAG